MDGASTSGAEAWGDATSFNISAFDFDNISNLELSALCCDEDYLGFDKNSGSTWIYPTNYPMRDYQFNIVKSALFKNTLVSLPTGLGKTFIAAVVMYNFYRWYPTGKIIFVAPTRPLVAQQIEACYKIMAIPLIDTIEMTGTIQTSARRLAWQQKRIVFATPQVVQNDLESGACPGELVRCLVIDEAHRARGRHSYCQLIESLFLRKFTLFRVLALSATPGSKVEDVINVVQNLKISHLELRTEECLDVSMYSHSRKIQTIVIELGNELTKIMQQFIEILNIYSRRLVQYKILNGNIGGLSKGRIIMLYKEYQNKEKSLRHAQHKYIMLDFTMLITLYHALELLTKHGARVFLNFFDEHTDKTWIGKDDKLTSFLERLRDDLGPDPLSFDISTLPDGSIPEIKEEFKFGHPKFDHLKKIMLEHFNNAQSKREETKAIVFCEYRESVNLVHRLLLQCRPLIKPQMFVGQGLGGTASNGQKVKPFSQKQQLRVMKSFREGTSNVLVSTCVGEEGLDVGSVDLIICFDISNKSPIRLVQRCGRTGRERGGRVVILVTEGREHQTLRDCMYQRDNLNKKVLLSKELQKCLFKSNPRMLPQNVNPQCCKMFITVKNIEANEKDQKGQHKINDLLKKINKNGLTEQNNDLKLISEEEFNRQFNGIVPSNDYFADSSELWSVSKKKLQQLVDCDLESTEKVSLSNRIEWQRILQTTFRIGHSSDSLDLTALLQYADLKRFDISQENSEERVTAINENCAKSSYKKNSPMKRKVKNPVPLNPKGKSANIKEMFSKINRINNNEQWLINEKCNEILKECGVDVTNQKTINTYMKENNISSTLIDIMVENELNKKNDLHEYSKYNLKFMDQLKKLNTKNEKSFSDIKNICIPQISLLDKFSNLSFVDHSSSFGKSLESVKILPTYVHSQYLLTNDKKLTSPIKPTTNLDIIDIDTIFEDSFSSSKSTSSTKKINKVSNNTLKSKNPLDFFGLESIDDIFADDSFDDPHSPHPNLTLSKEFDNSDDSTDMEIQSPIISTQKQSRNFSKLQNSKPIHESRNSINHSKNDTSLLSITQIINIFNDGHVSDGTAKVTNEEDKKAIDLSTLKNKDDINWDILDDNFSDSDGSSNSIILHSQKPGRKNMDNSKFKKEKPIAHYHENSDEHQRECIQKVIGIDDSSTNNLEVRDSAKKRKLSSDEELSPFFNKISKVESPLISLSKRTIHEKTQLSLSDFQNTSNFNFEKENIIPKDNFENSPIIKQNDEWKINHISQLSLFERTSAISLPKKGKIESINKNRHQTDSDDSEDFTQKPTFVSKVRKKNKMKKKRERKACEFIDYEAILSDDSYLTTSGESGTENSSTTKMESFICDEHVEEFENVIDMEAKYLQSVKSPPKTAGMFKIPAQLKPISNVFSQPVPEQDTFYELDSFCVDNDMHLTQHPEMSELEIAEAILNKRKRRKGKKTKQNNTESDESPVALSKRKCARLRIDSESDSDDENFK